MHTEKMNEQEVTEFKEALHAALAAIELSLSDGQVETLLGHYQRMVATNAQFNLTRITGPADAAVKHYADSLTLLKIEGLDRDQPATLLDVGTGAGFPALPLAVACPKWKVTAIDGTGKKIRFLEETASELGVSNLKAIHARGDELARRRERPFDMVVFRAVGKIADSLAECNRLPAPGGRMIFYKGANLPQEERDDANTTAKRVGLVKQTELDLQLPLADATIARKLISYGHRQV